jgi:predicted transcriptional regulator
MLHIEAGVECRGRRRLLAASKGQAMVTIRVQAEEEVLAELEEIARRRRSTVQAVATEALRHYVREQSVQSGPYSFIGIWHSGRHNLSREVEATLAQAADRREGWRQPE